MAGQTFEFRVRARNVHGWSSFSSTLSVIASGKPDQPAAPVTELSNQDIKISWTIPTSNYATISAYRIQIQNAFGTYLEESTYCNAAVDPIFSQLYCLVPMSHLISSYNHVKGTILAATVEAYNINGWSTASSASTGAAKIETIPIQMAQVTEGSSTDETQIEVEWTALSTDSETGGSSIIAYQL